MSIQSKLTRLFAAQTLVGLSLVSLGTYAAIGWSFELKRDADFQQHLEIVEAVVTRSLQRGDVPRVREDLDDHFQSHSDAAVTLVNDSRVIYSSRMQARGPGWETRTVWPDKLVAEGKPIEVRLSLDISNDRKLLQRLAWALAAAAALGSLLIASTGAILVRRGLKPLKILAAETAASGPDRPGHRLSGAGYASELQPWITQFNALLGRVESADVQQEAFNADVAHELRTPLSNMITQVDIELGRHRSAGELRSALESHAEEAKRLNGIVSDMLFLSRADRGAMARRGPARGLAEQTYAVIEFQEAVLEEAGLTISVEGDATFPMDTGLVRRAVSNLISNAQRHATPASRILVRIEPDGRQVRLTVENEGATIQADAVPRIFERFYRADPSRARSAEHHGLGLAIVAAIARMHGGKTFAVSTGGKTRVGLTMQMF